MHQSRQPIPPLHDKQTLRKSLLARRSALTPDEVAAASAKVHARLTGLKAWREAREVLLYMDFGGEIATAALLQELWRRKVRVLVPRCRPDQAGALDLACPTCPAELVPGAYGISEPAPDVCPAVDDYAPQLALIPAVGFDRMGARLGFGLGYYDRLLAGPQFSHTFLVGLAHRFQVVDRLPHDPWDRPVHVILTDEETVWP